MHLGKCPGVISLLLEIPVEGSRILLLLRLMGNGGVRGGIIAVKNIFRMKGYEWNGAGAVMLRRLKQHYKELLLWLIIYGLLAFIINYAIAIISNNPNVIHSLKQLWFIAPTLNATAITLFLKNLSVIPLTLFFEVWFVLRILGKV